MVHSYNGILQNKGDEQTAATHHNMDEFDKHDADCKKPRTKAYYMVLCTYSLLKKKKKLTYGIRSQKSGYPKAEGASDWEGP